MFGAGESIGHQLVAPGLFDQRLVGRVKLGEASRRRIVDHRHHQAPAAVPALDINRKAQIHLARDDLVGCPFPIREHRRHDRVGVGGANQGVTDEVGERDFLRPACRADRVVELAPASLEHGNRQLAEGRGGGDRKALPHVRHQAGGGAGDRGGVGRRRLAGWDLRRLDGGELGRLDGWTVSRGGFSLRTVPSRRRAYWSTPNRLTVQPSLLRPHPNHPALEQLPPLRAHRIRVPEKLLVHDLCEARVGGFEHVGISGHTALSYLELGGSGRVPCLIEDTKASYSCMRMALRLIPGLSVALFAAACSDQGPDTLTLSQAPAASGDQQTARVDAFLHDPVRVLVTQGGSPKAGVSVVWETSGGPTADLGPPTLTGSDGIAQTFWKMPQAEGPTLATAAVAGASGSPVTFQASAFADLPTRILIEAGDGQSQSSGMVFANLLAVRVTDHFLNRRPQVTVQWMVASGSVALDAYSSATDADGIATLAVTAGADSGSGHDHRGASGGTPFGDIQCHRRVTLIPDLYRPSLPGFDLGT